MWNEKELEFFDRYGKPRPEQSKHGSDTWEHPASANLTKLVCKNWRQQGNMLICDTPSGPLKQYIPTDKIFSGVDKNGLPILRDVYKQ